MNGVTIGNQNASLVYIFYSDQKKLGKLYHMNQIDFSSVHTTGYKSKW